jgi:L-aminopeptidase/D-esterase-like protein
MTALVRRAAIGCFLTAKGSEAESEAMSSEQPSEVSAGPMYSGSVCDVPGVRVGHFTHAQGQTGLTVVLFNEPAAGGACVRGSAPCTIGVDWLEPTGWLEEVHAAFLTGRSVFGLTTAAAALTRWLRERGVGLDLPGGPVPIVVGAGIYDLAAGDALIMPEEGWAYAAAEAASAAAPAQGSVGAGTGARCGRWPGSAPLKGGLGTAALHLPTGAVVAALVVVNAIGAPLHPVTRQPYALAGGFTDPVPPATTATARREPATTTALVVTNAVLSKTHLAKVADMAHDGLARAIRPAHLMLDGDVVFAFSAGGAQRVAAEGRLPREDADLVGVAAADALTRAVLNALCCAQGIPGWPAFHELRPDRQD